MTYVATSQDSGATRAATGTAAKGESFGAAKVDIESFGDAQSSS